MRKFAVVLLIISFCLLMVNENSQVLEKPVEYISGSNLSSSSGEVDVTLSEVKSYKSVLSIPCIDVLVNIYDGITEELLEKGVCRYTNTSELGADGLTVICGHSGNRVSYIFNDLKLLAENDNFYIWDKDGKKHIYLVTKSFIVDESEVWILNQEEPRVNKVRLFCCTNGGNSRLVVEGVEVIKKDFKELINSNIPLAYDDLINLKE